MTMPRRTLAAASLVAAGAIGAGTALVASPSESSTTFVGPAVQESLAEGQYVGPCSIVTPPEPDPCDAASAMLRFVALGAFERGAYHAKWVAANPGEISRLSTFMVTPKCSTPAAPLPQIMRTAYGEGLYAVVQASACARHPEQMQWPLLPPVPNPNRQDKTPPGAPGPIQVQPTG